MLCLHGCVLQGSLFVLLPLQSSPSPEGGGLVHVLCLLRVPPPQVLSQRPGLSQGDQLPDRTGQSVKDGENVLTFSYWYLCTKFQNRVIGHTDEFWIHPKLLKLYFVNYGEKGLLCSYHISSCCSFQSQ